MIHTLQSNLFLYKVNRNRQHYMTTMEKEKAFLYVSLITLCVTLSALLWIIHR